MTRETQPLSPMTREHYDTVDYHTGGEPFRIVTDLPVPIAGPDVPSKRITSMESPEVERIRRILCHEPRGHADMYGGFLVEPSPGADLGVLFWHKDGFSTACGHGTIALGTWAIESGRIDPSPSGVTDVVIDVPSGRVTARVHTDEHGGVTAVDFVNVPSYLVARDVSVQTSRGQVTVDIAYGGALYAQLDTTDLDLPVVPERTGEIIALGREVKWLLNDSPYAVHPTDPRLSGIYGATLFQDLGGQGTVHQRNATVFADGELDRSPCGSGTCARLATLTARGVLTPGDSLVHDSIVGSRFIARVLETTTADGVDAVIPQVTGTAHLTGQHRFVVDPRDELAPGFVLR
jgi:proline racemase/trans-L-3-hydroxyproline dehydratase